MLKRVLVGATVAGITVLVVRSLPELRRYIKIRRM
ncbi:DUF6893 family small protein [Actinomadura sp. HBU206391]